MSNNINPNKWGSNHVEPTNKSVDDKTEDKTDDKPDTHSEDPKTKLLDPKIVKDTPETNDPDKNREVKDKLSNDKYDTLSTEEATWKQRYADVRSYASKQETDYLSKATENATEIQTLKTQLIDKNFAKLPKTEEELKKFAEANPEINDVINTLVERKAIQINGDLEVKEAENKKALDNISMNRKLEELIKLGHTDAFDIYGNSASLEEWALTQSPGTKYLCSSGDVRDMDTVLRMYKKAKGIVTKDEQVETRRKTNEENSMLPNTQQVTVPKDGQGGNILTESEVLKWSDREYDQRAGEVNKARKEGKFIYDLSSNR